jgi:molybdopterin-guanine dinucleotide biosynthesis protein A
MKAGAVITGFVVAGGRSRRMGRDKALLPWGESTLLDHAVQRLQSVCSDVRILSGPEVRYLDRGLVVLPDQWPDAGPLGGLHAGLSALGEPDDLALFLAVDVPFVPVELLVALRDAAAGYDAVVPVAAGGPQPLCAAYRATCRAAIEERLRKDERRMTSFWPGVRVREMPDAEVRPFGDPARLFLNVNDADDLARARG